MAGMKYSPGFDDPPTRPKLIYKVIAVAVTLLTTIVLGASFLAYLSPSLVVDLGSLVQLCAQLLGLR